MMVYNIHNKLQLTKIKLHIHVFNALIKIHTALLLFIQF